MSQDVVGESLRWSPGGNELAFLGYAAGRDQPVLLYRLDPRAQVVSAESLKDLDAAPPIRQMAEIEWTADGSLIMRAAKRAGDQRPEATARRGLVAGDSAMASRNAHCVDSGAAGRNMASGWTDRLCRRGRRESLARPSRRADGGPHCALPSKSRTDFMAGKNQCWIGGVSPPPARPTIESSSPRRTWTGPVPTCWTCAPEPLRAMEKPAPEAEVVAYSPLRGTSVFYAAGRNGLRAWRSGEGQEHPKELFSANQFFQEITAGEVRFFEYRSPEWRKTPRAIYRPARLRNREALSGADVGVCRHSLRQAPACSREHRHEHAAQTCRSPLPRAMLCCCPACRCRRTASLTTRCCGLRRGVLPAVDKLIEMGVADPEGCS